MCEKSKYIIANDYDDKHRITLTMILSDMDENKPLEPEVLTRDQIISQIKNGIPFFTSTIDQDELCHTKVLLHLINNEWFIKIQPDDVPADYLGYAVSAIT